jgi:hypothetical protein
MPRSLMNRRPFVLTTTLVLALLAAVLVAGPALAAKPGTPMAKAPKGDITTTTPTFTWSKVAGAVKYELRVYKGTTLLVREKGITKPSWYASYRQEEICVALNTNVRLTWLVRASNARGAGVWSKRLTFKVVGIGKKDLGGKIAYILQKGDPGYVAGETHGLVAAVADQSAGIQWYNGEYFFPYPPFDPMVTGTTAQALGTGLANTNRIIAVQGPTATAYAAGLARAYDGGGYSDWFLPSLDELNKLYINRAAIGGFFPADFIFTSNYWSSSEDDFNFAWQQSFGRMEYQHWAAKDVTYRVRAVRAF